VRAAMANLRPAMNFDAAKEIHCIGCDRHLNPFLRLETISCRMPTYIFGTLSQNYALEVLSNFYLFTILHEGLTSNSTSFFVYNIWCGIFYFQWFRFCAIFSRSSSSATELPNGWICAVAIDWPPFIRGCPFCCHAVDVTAPYQVHNGDI
jgi:hypothetical protein